MPAPLVSSRLVSRSPTTPSTGRPVRHWNPRPWSGTSPVVGAHPTHRRGRLAADVAEGDPRQIASVDHRRQTGRVGMDGDGPRPGTEQRGQRAEERLHRQHGVGRRWRVEHRVEVLGQRDQHVGLGLRGSRLVIGEVVELGVGVQPVGDVARAPCPQPMSNQSLVFTSFWITKSLTRPCPWAPS